MDKLWKHDAEWKKEEDHMLYKSIYMKCPEQANLYRKWLVVPRNSREREWGVTANGS